jgi:hypothetical protein
MSNDWGNYRNRFRQKPIGRVGHVTLVSRGESIILRWRQDGGHRWERMGRCSEADVMVRANGRAHEINQELIMKLRDSAVFDRATVSKACDFFLQSKEVARRPSGATIRKYSQEIARVKQFAEKSLAGQRCRFVHEVDSQFCEDFCRWLDGILTTGNGGPATERNRERPFGGKQKQGIKRRFRSVLEHAQERVPPLVKPGFRNPMTTDLARDEDHGDNELSEPLVSVEELAAVVPQLDTYALGLLAPLLLYGPRPSELGRILLADHDMKHAFLHMRSRAKTGYRTKGRQNKFWPVGEPLAVCIRPFLAVTVGPLFMKRKICERRSNPIISSATADVLAREFEHRKMAEADLLGSPPDKIGVERISNAVWAAAGAADARDVRRELKRAARRAGLERIPKPVDCRHLFVSLCRQERLSDGVTRHLLGHRPLRGDSLVHYDDAGRSVMREHVALVNKRRRPLLDALVRRASELAS